MTQTLAIFHEAYRNLNSKKLFWIVLLLSVLGVATIACVGINEHGIKVLVWQINSDYFNSQHMPAGAFYKWVFTAVGIGFWLSWLATILALISTAGIFPDLLTSGSIDLFLSKPISRLRLFLTEYVAGLLFVTLQVAVFSVASFLVIGIRGGEWEPGLFMAIPLTVCFFSYLFAVCVLVGVLTRSTMAALLLTLLFWFFVFVVGSAESGLFMFKTMREHDVDVTAPPAPVTSKKPTVRDSSSSAEAVEGTETTNAVEESPPPADKQQADKQQADKQIADKQIADKQIADKQIADKQIADKQIANKQNDDRKGEDDFIDVCHRVLYGVKTVLPKTTETIALLERVLIDLARLPQPTNQSDNPQQQRMQAAGQEVAESLRHRSVSWVVGTSLGFEAFVLAWAAFVFCRRSY